MSSVSKEIVVQASPERAFRVFTENFDSWWPRGHHIGKADLKAAVMESKPNGRWYEVGVDGSECEWGYVIAWEPPHRLVLAWQLNGQWQYDPNLVTEVEVTFTPLGAGTTRVELEHRNLERFGEHEDAVRKAIGADQGWGGLLRLYAEAAKEAAA
jgi:uncharacterized protein YndB with AHSA1/START domain